MSPQAAQTAPNAVVVGMGRTGLSVARHLQRSGFRIAVTDSRAAPPELEGVKALGASVVTRTGGFDVQLLERADIVVTSPGVPLDDPFFVQARARPAGATQPDDERRPHRRHGRGGPRRLRLCSHAQRTFSVPSPISTRITDIIQKRTMTLGSAQPLSSK